MTFDDIRNCYSIKWIARQDRKTYGCQLKRQDYLSGVIDFCYDQHRKACRVVCDAADIGEGEYPNSWQIPKDIVPIIKAVEAEYAVLAKLEKLHRTYPDGSPAFHVDTSYETWPESIDFLIESDCASSQELRQVLAVPGKWGSPFGLPQYEGEDDD
ncbi:MAG: hypothetical protein VB835_18945 [Pirellulales bacterium]